MTAQHLARPRLMAVQLGMNCRDELVIMDEKWSDFQDTATMDLDVCAILFRIDRSKGTITVTRDSTSVFPILEVITSPSEDFAYVAVLMKEDLRYRISGNVSVRYFYRQKLESAKGDPPSSQTIAEETGPAAKENDTVIEESDPAAKENGSTPIGIDTTAKENGTAPVASDAATEPAKELPPPMSMRTRSQGL